MENTQLHLSVASSVLTLQICMNFRRGSEAKRVYHCCDHCSCVSRIETEIDKKINKYHHVFFRNISTDSVLIMVTA